MTSVQGSFFSAEMLRLYKQAVQLNNMGVRMMGTACYQQGFDTFKDGLQVMQQVAASNGSPRRTDSMEKARHRASFPQPADQRVARLETVVQNAELSCTLAEIFCEQEFGAPALYGTCSVIQITDCLELLGEQDGRTAMPEEEDEDCDLHLPTAIFLHNLAVASYCRSDNNNKKRFQDALRLSRLCSSLLEPVIAASENVQLVSRAVLFAALTLRLRRQLLAQQDTRRLEVVVEAEECLQTLNDLREVAAVLGSLLASKIAPAA